MPGLPFGWACQRRAAPAFVQAGSQLLRCRGWGRWLPINQRVPSPTAWVLQGLHAPAPCRQELQALNVCYNLTSWAMSNNCDPSPWGVTKIKVKLALAAATLCCFHTSVHRIEVLRHPWALDSSSSSSIGHGSYACCCCCCCCTFWLAGPGDQQHLPASSRHAPNPGGTRRAGQGGPTCIEAGYLSCVRLQQYLALHQLPPAGAVICGTRP